MPLLLFLILYAYLGYPLLLWGLTRVSSRKKSLPQDLRTPLPSLTLLIAAYNEESVIQEKIENALALDWPEHLYEIVVVSDGSTDRTNSIVRSFNDPRVKLLALKKNAGKLNALNKAIPHCHGELIALSDSNSLYDVNALKNMASRLNDPKVGAVCGELRYQIEDSNQAGQQEGLYWRYEKKIKSMESQLNTLIGANGSIYMIRKEDYPFPQRDLMDDLSVPLLIFLKTSKKTVYEPAAVAREKPGENFEEEYQRKVRIITRGIYTLMSLSPKWIIQPTIAFQILSHKFCRWFVPIFAILLAITSTIATLESPTFTNPALWLFLAQAVFYALLSLVIMIPRLKDSSKILSIVYYLYIINKASLQGILNYMLGKNITRWKTIREK